MQAFQAPLPDGAEADRALGGDDPVRSRPARYDRRGPSAPAVSVVVPTYNEVENLPLVLAAVGRVLADFDYEIIVVDDNSPDATWQLAEELAAADRRIRVVRRIGRRGLSSAVLEGMGVADGRVLAVIDADLQHDEAVLPDLVSAVLDGDVDLCLGSRQAAGGSYGPFGPGRRLISWVGAMLARRLLGVAVSDPMSGFFALSRQRFDAVVSDVNPRGFKILLEFLARGDRPRVGEVGYRFRTRTHGHTKLTGSVVLAYLLALLELALARLADPRMVAYASVAVAALSARIGLAAVLTATLSRAGAASWATLVAIETTVLAELVLHHRWTFGPPDRPLPRLGTTLRFHLVSGYGILAQQGAAALLERHLIAVAGPIGAVALLVAAAALVVITVLGSYLVNRSLTWPGSPAPGGDARADP